MSGEVAAVLRRPRRFSLESGSSPTPGQDELLVRMEGSGVCGSDLDLWRGRPWFDYPFPPGGPGHEGWGRVEAAGSGTSLLPGTRVALLSDRCFASIAVVPQSEVVPIPESLEGVPVPGEALGCGFNVVEMAGIEQGSQVAVVGAGFLGSLLIALAKARGALTVAFSRREHSRRMAATMGAETTFSSEVPDSTRGHFGIVIEATGAQDGLDLATALVAPGGRLVIAGYHQDGPRQVDMQTWNWDAIEVVNAHVRDRARRLAGMRGAIEWLAAGRFDPTPLYTHRYGLGELDAAFTALACRPSGFTKALVTV